jgi:hypothetical protein
LRLAPTVFATIRSSRFFNQFAESHRGAAWLGRQPLPMSRKKRYFARDNTQFRPPWSTNRSRVFEGGSKLGQTRRNILIGSSQIEINLPARIVIKDEHRRLWVMAKQGLDGKCQPANANSKQLAGIYRKPYKRMEARSFWAPAIKFG